MLVGARHLTHYEYSAAAFCEPMVLRFRPRDDGIQRLRNYELCITPEPAGRSEQLDLEGNVVTRVWFQGLVSALSIEATWEVETLCENPFDFLLAPTALRLPVTPPAESANLWALYATPRWRHPRVVKLVEEVAEASRRETLTFLCQLARRICESHEKLVRHEGPAWSPEETLARKGGSCRDLTELFLEACRTMGLPARFVSGYALSDDDSPQHLHAWGEVFLPGAGWMGFDPMTGLAVADRHIAVAAALTPAGAAPTEGSFRSNSAVERLEVEVELRQLPETAPAGRSAGLGALQE